MTNIANVTQSGVTEILRNAWLLRVGREGGGGRTNHYNRLMSGKKKKKTSLFIPSGTFKPNTAIKKPGNDCRDVHATCAADNGLQHQRNHQSRAKIKRRTESWTEHLRGQVFKNTNKAKEHSLMLDWLGCWSWMLAEHLWTSIQPCFVVHRQRTRFPSMEPVSMLFPSGLTFLYKGGGGGKGQVAKF